ncbi:NAD-dependent succinate-semialdehyde dehydrogenase [Rhodovulum sulfidophilum]|uniref:NAD-dependent succinate-semialdehyde dehydrogenase n=1 Tax=Rhodovulum sulfidophilum TaxID=35806 RepID=UPI001922E27D|nr:NAD-dependent succinate-semialdehyde dehydrogenase [Rhodovulum sulfidophilum]MBL3574965.1 NAD-dependent succinate-semialdehyde dehydrogenase [Rhodovulum sulfidophilum]MCE8432197.1 NAD-dependent succinate-semialdehyde dehydrogenase [Rhodovulum sulfidophilum]MCF4119220.1 NAD-dependent succinate-semialdehyde dehydrogenase [Rhodovulum sulfidophilum]
MTGNTIADRTGLSDRDLLRDRSRIGGDWVGSETRFEVRDPADGAVLGNVAAMSADQSRAAIDSAQAAFPGWAATLPQDRSAILRRWFELVTAAREDLARIMTVEQGKPLSEARGEIDYAASFIEFYAEEAKRPNIEGVTSHLPDAEVELWLEPVGVVALITPWNFPAAMLTRKAAAALAAGCSVLAHPSAETPYSALALAELAARAGVPPGVFNVVTGDAATIVGPWTEDPRVRALSFTGSTEIGRLLYRQSAATVKRLVLELGGHAPVIVFSGAELDHAVAETIKAKFATSGQDCLGANRIYVERPVYDEFCRRFTAATQALTVGRGMDDPDIGPLMNEAALTKQEDHVADALAKGAKLACGGARLPLGPLFYAPTVLTDVPHDAKIMREETFGPVAALTPFDTEDEVIARANDSEFGLVAYVHSLNPRRIYRVSRALQYGMVAVNRTKVTGAPIPFGGMKQSGIGREGARRGMEAFMEIKYVCRDWH